MKNTIFLLAVSTLLTVSCTKYWNYDVEEIEYGFNTEFHDYSKEFILMDVNNDNAVIQLKGNVELYNGSIEIEVIQPDGTAVFEKIMDNKSKLELEKVFPAQRGYWKLKYQSSNGKGFINLHLKQ